MDKELRETINKEPVLAWRLAIYKISMVVAMSNLGYANNHEANVKKIKALARIAYKYANSEKEKSIALELILNDGGKR